MADLTAPIAVVYGTRPEIIKLGPLIRLLAAEARLVNTGQHFDWELSGAIADEFQLPPPHATLGVGGVSRATQIARAIEMMEEPLSGSAAVVVQGDTNSALAGALAANSMEIPLFHVEAGLRSWDRRMPEEHNRVLIDHLADMCWAPTEFNVTNLAAENIAPERILRTGNPIVESLAAIAPDEQEIPGLIGEFGLESKGYVLVTLHRPENVDDPRRLAQVLGGLGRVGLPVIFPIHPRTLATVTGAGLGSLLDGLVVVPPVGYRAFLALLAGCCYVISDSGGVQEEVSVLKVPMIVLRRSTERPEVLDTFARLTDDVVTMTDWALELEVSWEDRSRALGEVPTPYGDGLASGRMLESLRQHLR